MRRLIVIAVIFLSWQDNAANETAFIIERQVGGSGNWRTVGQVGRDATVFQDPNVKLGQRQCYRVRAINAAGSSAPSNVACGVGH